MKNRLIVFLILLALAAGLTGCEAREGTAPQTDPDGGATDDDAKLIKAKGYAKCLEASSFKVEGMPERLTMVKGEVGSFGLGILQEEK